MPSELDTFYILFKTDAEEVAEGAKGAKASVDDLEKGIGGADKASATMGKTFNNLASTAVASFASVFAVTQLISSAQGIAAQATELGVLGEVLGESTAELTNWGRAVQAVGGDQSAFESSMRSLGSSLGDALINGPNAATTELQKLGISGRDAHGKMKTVLDLLPELAGQFQNLTRESALARGKALGLDEGTILLLMKGEAGVAALVGRQRQLNSVTDAETATLRELNAKWNEYSNFLSDIATEILVALVPAIAMMEQGFTAVAQFVAENEGVMMAFLTGLGIALAAVAVQAFILVLPFVLMAAAIGAVILVVGALAQDIMAFVTGQDSMLGAAAERWSFIGDAIELVQAGIQKLVDIFGVLQSVMSSISIPDILGGAAEGLLGFLDSADATFRGLIGGDVAAGQEQLATAGGAPIQAIGASAAAGVGGASNRSSTVNVGEVKVETQATDAAGIASGISSALQTELQNAIDETDDGVAA